MGIFAKIKKAWFDTIVWETIDDEFYDELEDSLIMADLGATVAHDAVKKLRDVVYQKSIQRGDDVKQALRDILIEKLNVGDTALDLSTKPIYRSPCRATALWASSAPTVWARPRPSARSPTA